MWWADCMNAVLGQTVSETTAHGEVERRHLAVDGPNGVVPGRVTLRAGATGPQPLLLLGHGGGGGKDERGFPQIAARFAVALGAAVLAIDGPVHGERQPEIADPVERYRAGRRALVDPEMPARFTEDWRVSIAALRDNGIGAGPLAYIGFSMGTLLGVPTVAALGAEVVGAVFGVGGVPAKGGVAELIRSVAGDAAADIAEEEDDAELRGRIALDAARRTASTTQVLMMNTTRDIVFPIPGALELFDAFAGPKRIVFWDGGHTDLGSEAMGLATDFLQRVITNSSGDREGGVGAW